MRNQVFTWEIKGLHDLRRVTPYLEAHSVGYLCQRIYDSTSFNGVIFPRWLFIQLFETFSNICQTTILVAIYGSWHTEFVSNNGQTTEWKATLFQTIVKQQFWWPVMAHDIQSLFCLALFVLFLNLPIDLMLDSFSHCQCFRRLLILLLCQSDIGCCHWPCHSWPPDEHGLWQGVPVSLKILESFDVCWGHC